MNKFIWLIICIVAVVIQATSTNFAYAFGGIAVWFIVGMVLSPIWWVITKKRRSATPWQWFDWLNAGAYIMIGLQILSIVVRSAMREQIGV
jgi:hypothetical protein